MPICEPVHDMSATDIRPIRERLPDTRESVTHKFTVEGHEGYITVGLYPDGRPGEVFVKIAKHGSTISGLFDTIAILTSMNLQYGVPVEVLARKFEYTRFEPCGWTKNPEIHHVNSIVDYVFRWLGTQYSEAFQKEHREAEDDQETGISADRISADLEQPMSTS